MRYVSMGYRQRTVAFRLPKLGNSCDINFSFERSSVPFLFRVREVRNGLAARGFLSLSRGPPHFQRKKETILRAKIQILFDIQAKLWKEKVTFKV